MDSKVFFNFIIWIIYDKSYNDILKDIEIIFSDI